MGKALDILPPRDSKPFLFLWENMAREFSKSFYRSKEWKAVRQYVLMRDKYLCCKCGKPANEVHHKIVLNESNINNKDVILNPNNLISLCKECHFDTHKIDKATGIRKHLESTGQAKHELDIELYMFDENGFLIEKK